MKKKYSFIIFSFLISLIACNSKVSYDELKFKENIAQYNGKPYTGSFFESFPNGDIKSEGQYKNGLKIGKFTRYFKNKQIFQEKSYIIEDGTKNSYSFEDGLSKEFHEDGTPSLIVNYKAGKKDGIEEIFNQKGYKYSTSNYKDDKLNGESVKYFSDGPEGVLEFKGTYINGKPNGELIKFYENGKLFYKSFYENGTKKNDVMYDRDGKLLSGADF